MMTHANLNRALADAGRRPVSFRYRPERGTPGLRVAVSAWEIRGASVLGWDHGRCAFRSFRLDRMADLRHAPSTVTYREPDR